LKQYLISDEHREIVIGWCKDHMVMHKDYIWFPMYVTTSNKAAFRIDIFNDEDAIVFTLTWRDLVE